MITGKQLSYLGTAGIPNKRRSGRVYERKTIAPAATVVFSPSLTLLLTQAARLMHDLDPIKEFPATTALGFRVTKSPRTEL